MTLKVYNTLSKGKEEFVPRKPGEVSIYACGITPYNYAHIGNARPAVFWDTVRRFLHYRGNQIRFIQNFTDVDDKIINRANQLGKQPLELAEEYARIYLEDLKALGIQPAERYPKVSEHIPEIIEMVRTLVDKGAAYVLNGDVYFDVAHFKTYGRLSGRNLEEMQAGARVEVNEAKKDPMDFALWKAAKPGEIFWESPWGPGRPGWHIECSAMSLKYLGSGFDMHGGGEDLVFPHHENEIAQSESYSGQQFVRYWLHNAFITVGGERMGKSMGNFSSIHDVLAKFPGPVIRMWNAGTHYRNPLSFGEEELANAARSLERIENARFNWEHLLKQPAAPEEEGHPGSLAELSPVVAQTESDFIAAMEDDFNTPQALASLFELIREINRWIQSPEFQPTKSAQAILESALHVLKICGGILGLFGEGQNKPQAGTHALSEAEIEALIAKRIQAKKEKLWAEADQIRNDLKAAGIILEDTPQGVRWRVE